MQGQQLGQWNQQAAIASPPNNALTIARSIRDRLKVIDTEQQLFREVARQAEQREQERVALEAALESLVPLLPPESTGDAVGRNR